MSRAIHYDTNTIFVAHRLFIPKQYKCIPMQILDKTNQHPQSSTAEFIVMRVKQVHVRGIPPYIVSCKVAQGEPFWHWRRKTATRLLMANAAFRKRGANAWSIQ